MSVLPDVFGLMLPIMSTLLTVFRIGDAGARRHRPVPLAGVARTPRLRPAFQRLSMVLGGSCTVSESRGDSSNTRLMTRVTCAN
jgi:hypothetical protein